ncbi:MAG: NAD(P)H-quinone oxidoreductase [Nakamurella sp.]
MYAVIPFAPDPALATGPTAGSPTLDWVQVPDPILQPGEVLIEVAAAGVNRADLLQARGRYAPPPGASSILGLECSGTIVDIHPDTVGTPSHSYDAVRGFAVGDAVCALLSGGGYAQRVAVPATQVLPVPQGVSLVDAAGLPEVACTVWSNLVMTAGLTSGKWVLVHGGSSGIGTMAIQIARSLGARVLTTASTSEKLSVARNLGAEVAIDYSHEDFVIRVMDATDAHGADIILDVVGGEYLARNISALADGGRLVIIGLLGGSRAELDIASLMAKRAGVIGTQLRNRPQVGPGSKAEVVDQVRRHVWPLIESGDILPVIGARLPIQNAADAHHMMAGGAVIGKTLLTRGVPGDQTP